MKRIFKFLNKKDLSLFILIFLASIFLRILNFSQQSINPDEYHWHNRSNRFYHAIMDKKWDQTYQTEHPGTTLMWSTVTALRVSRLIYRRFDPAFDYQDYPYLLHTFERIHFAVAFPLMLITAAFIGFFYLCLKDLASRQFSILATLLVLTDIYFLANSRTVQMDALQTAFIMSSLLSALLFNKHRQPAFLILSAILASLNVLTKLPGLIVLPVVLLVVNFKDLKALLTFKTLKPLSGLFFKTTFFFAVFSITSFITLPALLTDFNQVTEKFKYAIFSVGIEGVKEQSEFYLGKIVERGEGYSFYILSLLFRQSLIPFLMFIPSLILLWKERKRGLPEKNLVLFFLFFTFFWAAILSIPVKKEDRYILPTHVSLNIVAAYPFYRLYQIRHRNKNKFMVSFTALSLIIFAISAKPLNFDYMGYYNPLLGGNKTAVKLIRVGWGEGLKPIALYLNQLENADDIKVASWYANSYSPYTKSKITYEFNWEDEDAEYLVFYVNQIQRNQEPVMIEKYFKKEYIVYTSVFNGLEFAWLVKKPI